ncbi:MAG: type II secretion system F family protein [Actinobacteria bacterium]|nr:type II secretion system F family protein [Actinomycetota bacterium]
MMFLAASAAAAAALLVSGVISARPLLADPVPVSDLPGIRVTSGTLAAVAGVLFAAALFGPVAAVLSAAAVLLGRRIAARRRLASDAGKVVEQIPDAVAAIAAGMRAGLSLSQSIAYAARELDPPLSLELGELVERVELGMSLDGSIGAWAVEGGPEVRLTCSVLQLHRRTGGELPKVLERVASTLEQRREASREARSLTAQARLSGAILGLLPVGFFGFMFLLSPSEMSQVIVSPVGLLAIGVGFCMQGLAFLWIRSLLKVES